MAERVLLAISVIVHGKRSGEIYEKMDLHLVGSRNCSWPYEWLQQKCGNAENRQCGRYLKPKFWQRKQMHQERWISRMIIRKRSKRILKMWYRSRKSLQKELEQIDTIIQKFSPLAEKAETQGEMNASSRWFYVIWDTELNNLWSRFMNLADQKTKESVLAEQRNWVAMKEEATLLSIGSSEENGSIYPLLQNSFLEEITKNRACVLASKLAGIKGEDFMLPDRSNKYGLFVDNQGTGNVYSALVTREGLNGENEAVISVYRTGETRGTFTDHGNGELAFASDDGNVRGIIYIDGWKGASFHVTEVTGNSAFTVGEELEFPFAF